MARLGTEIAGVLRGLSADSARMVRIAQVRQAYARAVRKVWRNNPGAVRLILERTNAVYVRRDDRPRKGPDKNKPLIVCEVYSDDSMVRAELDTWQQILQLALVEQGIRFDEFRIFPSKLGMKERHPFQKLLELDLARMDAKLAEAPPSASPVASPESDEAAAAFRRAVILTFGEAAESVLAKMDEVTFVPAVLDDEHRTARRALMCTVRTGEPTLERLLVRYRKNIRDNAAMLGLRIRSLRVVCDDADEDL